MELPPEILATIIGFTPKTANICLVSKFWNSEVQRMKENAVAKIGEWYRNRKLVVDYDTMKLTHQAWVRFFVTKYPLQYVNTQVHLALWKIGNNQYVRDYPRKERYTMVDLKNLLEKMTTSEIEYLGW